MKALLLSLSQAVFIEGENTGRRGPNNINNKVGAILLDWLVELHWEGSATIGLAGQGFSHINNKRSCITWQIPAIWNAPL